MIVTKKVGPEFDKEWGDKIYKIICFTSVDRKSAHEALMNCDGDLQLAINSIIEGGSQPNTSETNKDTYGTTTINTMGDVKMAHQTSFKPKPPTIEERMRKENTAVGIQNVGSTCFFSVLAQIYYSLPDFVE